MKINDRILKAINEGIYNALSADIPDQDIDFNSDDVDNNFEVLNMLVSDFLLKPDSDKMKSISDICSQNNCKYVVPDFEQYSCIYWVCFRSGSLDLSWVDTHDIISIVLSNGYEMTYCQRKYINY